VKRILVMLAALLFSGLALAAVNIKHCESAGARGAERHRAGKSAGDHRPPQSQRPVQVDRAGEGRQGVGDATFDKIKGDISVSGATTMPAGAMKAEPAKAATPAMKAERRKPRHPPQRLPPLPRNRSR
jgi:competence protein ComEA